MHRGRKQKVIWLMILLGGIALFPINLYSAATGQIKGLISDKDSEEPVIGASVMIVGTDRGAMTDFDGRYIISQLEPGKYSVRISSLEYNTATITDIVVKSDYTTDASIALTKKVSKLDLEITVRGEHDILDRFVTENQVTISKETIEHQPVTTVDELLTQVSGVTTNQQGEVFIRGGRAFEVGYIVDGVPLGDPLGGLGQAGANLSLVSGSIQEFTVIKDGFDPEYGDALSGIVKITTQAGSKDISRMNIQYITDDFGNASLNKYSRNNDFVRFTLSGPDPILKTKVFPALGLNFLEDKELTYFFYAEADKHDGVYQYSRFDTPETKRNEGSFNLFGFNIPEKRINKYYWMSNFKFRPTQNLK
ncbi:MAG: carboxypeptidase regulatory-like domain-containing protein, partial [Candidatus Zixiibacteriota bacterium]